MRADALAAALRDARRAGDRLRAGRQRQHRRLRPAAADRRRRARGRRLGARRRRLRALGRGLAAPARAGGRASSGADSWARRRPQVAQRPLRLRRSRSSPTPRRTRPRCRSHGRATSSAGGERDAPTTSPRSSRRAPADPGLRRAALPRPPRVAELVERCCAPRAPAGGRDGARRRRRGAQRRRAQPGAAALRRRRRADRRGDRGAAARGEAWLGGTVWHGMARGARLVLELVDHRRRRRPPRGGAALAHAVR